MMSLIGVPVVLLGLLLRFNPLLVVTAAALVTGLAAGVSPVALIAELGKGYNDARFVTVVFLVLPVVGLMERAGLQAKAREVVGRFRVMTSGRVILAYFIARQVSSAAGLLSLGGQANMVRPLIAPMAEGAAEAELGPGPPERAVEIRAQAAAADNVGAFFGEDIFVALGSVLLIVAVLGQNHLTVAPTTVAFWAIPTAVIALLVHGGRLLRLDRRLKAMTGLAERPGR
jgi:uncharacterized membrane protein